MRRRMMGLALANEFICPTPKPLWHRSGKEGRKVHPVLGSESSGKSHQVLAFGFRDLTAAPVDRPLAEAGWPHEAAVSRRKIDV